MAKTSQRSLINKILLFSAFLLGFAFQGVYGQSLEAGDVAFTAFNGEGSDSDDGFAVVIFKNISADEEIHFSSKEWDGSDFTGPGGDFTWVAPSGGVSSGTVLVFNDVEDVPSVNAGTITDDADMNLSGNGDVVYAYISTIDKDEGDYSFLGAIASEAAIYDGGEGSIPTELSEGTTAILLPTNIDNAEYIGDRSGNTPSGYRTLLNDVGTEEATDDNWDIYNGGDVAPIPPFSDESFTVVTPPTIAFTALSIDSTEDSGTAELTVELVEANGTAVDVEVAFLSSSSTVTNGDDFANFTTETVNFESSDVDGATETVTINLTDDSEFEGTEKAVFQLQNNTEGTIIEPSELTLTIEDNDAPDIVINEILADPAGSSDEDLQGDADGNGARDPNDDEFVEFINNQDADIDISGWKFFNEDDHKHTFTEGTVIPANGALVLFGDDTVSPQGNFGGAIIQSSNESASLSLVNGGDTISLEDENGNQVVSVDYSDANNDQSIVRDPEIKGDFKNHSDVADGNDNLFSPGTEVDGTPFGSKHAIGIRGTEGWRMISSPVQDATFEDFFGDFWMQGISGSNAPNDSITLAEWSESDTSFVTPSTMSDAMVPGKGYIVYVFEDDDNNAPGIQGGFPKIINSDGDENSGQINIDVSANDADGENGIDGEEGWNLLGNPFGTDLSVSAVLDALEDVDPNVQAQIRVWDHTADNGNGKYLTLQDGDRLAPFQAFFIKYTADNISGSMTFDKSAMEANRGTEFYKNSIEDIITFDLQLHGDQYYDTYSLEFSENGTTELDRYDAYKLFSLNSDAISLFSTQSNNRLQKNALPRELESNLEIPLSFDANGRTSLTFQWDNSMESIPNEWDLILIDNQQNREVNLRRNKEYSFSVNQQQEKMLSSSDKKGLLNKAKKTQDSRFVLSVQSNVQGEISSDLPESVKLKPNYPNPFNPTTTIPYELTQDSDVLLTVWNMIGQKVATLVDGTVEAGTHEEMWNASDMPSGIYIARFEVNGTVFTRKMTLIK